MDKERISEIEEIIERHLFDEANNTEYDLKKMDVIIKYLIYQELKEWGNSLSLIDEAISSKE